MVNSSTERCPAGYLIKGSHLCGRSGKREIKVALTRDEISAILGVSGDIDLSAHFECYESEARAAVVERAFTTAIEKLQRTASTLDAPRTAPKKRGK